MTVSGGGAALQRSFGLWGLILTGIGTVVGSGIFVITGQAAATLAGPALALSFVVAAIVCGLSALCYAEMAGMVPRAGSASAYAEEGFGRNAGWIVGWALIAEYLFAMGALAIGWSAYLQSFLADAGIALPAALTGSPISLEGRWFVATGKLVDLPAALIVALVMLSHFAALRDSGRANNAIVVLKLSAVAVFVAVGLAHADPANWTPFIPEPVALPGGGTAFGWPGILAAAGMVFFAYLGFDALGTAAQESHNPQRTVPLALLGTLAASTLLYIAVTMAMTGLADYRTLDTPAPIATALAAAGPSLAWLKTAISLSVIVGLWASLWACVFALSRLFFALAENGWLPAGLTRIAAGANVPRRAVALAGGLAGGLGVAVSGLLPIGLLGELISTGTLLAFAAVCAAVARLRLREPDHPRPFRAPLWQVTAPLGALAALGLLASMGWFAIERILIWQAIGVVLLVVMSRRRAR